MNRTHNCGELSIKNKGEEVILQGWVKKVRNIGQVAFIDLKDMYGVTQILVSDHKKDLLSDLKSEYVIKIIGTVIERKSKNLNLSTGEIEIELKELEIINKSEITPFLIEDEVQVNEDTRMSYRYLDLRRPVIQKNLILRSTVNKTIRNEFDNLGFIEVETPIFGKSTPEGARDFLVPSRLNPNNFYALPQSPQLYKQLLMIGGFDKYYQIARCFRDEDLRIDRQPEFSQLDMEMSFSSASQVQEIIEKVVKKVIKNTVNVDINEAFLKMTYKEAIDVYGVDKPDLRFNLHLKTLTEIFKSTNIHFFSNIKSIDSIRGIMVESLLSKKDLEILNEAANQKGFNSLAFIKHDNGNWSGSLASSLSDQEKEELIKVFEIKDQATILLNFGKYQKVSEMLGVVRNKAAEILGLTNKNDYKFLWVIDFPLFEWSEEEQKFVAAHNPFTMPHSSSIENFESDKQNAIADSYDLVLNGFELGSGSVRITNPEVQTRMFEAIGLDQKTIDNNFGWFINAYKYGAPIHAGFGLGIDRLTMILAHTDSIRDVIAFPKNSKAHDLMNHAPGNVAQQQLDELYLKIIQKK
ncbi:aspartate--tRNA ligase [Mesoplasma corruscae]|uniref:Aspartate--tRNA ligase n=1 Tax=Mesoplasma corruscae TaxID=216874 RepID=A0A2S5RG75_9MOLU|nr:aspartate--tRNA ligase [Mesoplasma corruscae]PPE06301.1 aspartyl-tRNA synthetase [Mesoplasma corruscae]